MSAPGSGPGFCSGRARGRSHPHAVLIVEDQPELLRALRINLLARQYDVLTARTGREALALAAERAPDAIILDLGLPDIDGTEVIVELRRWSKAPIIVLSGRTSPGDKIGALDVGADDYVTKPFAMGELLARLRAALRRDEARDRRRAGRPGHPSGGGWSIWPSHQVTRVPGEESRTTPDAEHAAPDAHRMAHPGVPAAAARASSSGRRRSWPGCGGPAFVSADQLPALPHGAAAPQAGARSGAAALADHRAGHGLPLSALNSRPRYTARNYAAKCVAQDLLGWTCGGLDLWRTWLTGSGDEGTSPGRPARDRRVPVAGAAGRGRHGPGLPGPVPGRAGGRDQGGEP